MLIPLQCFTVSFLETEYNIGTVKSSLNYTLQISLYYSTR
jgi:hypothetical protein